MSLAIIIYNGNATRPLLSSEMVFRFHGKKILNQTSGLSAQYLPSIELESTNVELKQSIFHNGLQNNWRTIHAIKQLVYGKLFNSASYFSNVPCMLHQLLLTYICKLYCSIIVFPCLRNTVLEHDQL